MYSTHEGYNDSIHGYYLEDLKVGMSASHAKTVTETDVVMFAGLTGDNSPVHCNEVFAARTRFKGRIAHGMFCAGLISACVAGTRLPGPGCICVDQQLRFTAPVRIGDTRHGYMHYPGDQSGTPCESLPERDLHRAKDKIVVEGSATFLVSRRNPYKRLVSPRRRTASPDGEPYALLFHDHPKSGHRVAVVGFCGAGAWPSAIRQDHCSRNRPGSPGDPRWFVCPNSPVPGHRSLGRIPSRSIPQTLPAASSRPRLFG
ncbi:MAG: MaoC family dehydratase [Comamonadaceae bacterium]|nr:MaoC family dehydratase [Comamonadaceae bacterium]